MSITRYNYVNRKKQLATLAQFSSIVELELKNYMDSQSDSVEANRTFEDLQKLLSERKLTKKQCVFTLSEHFKKLFDDRNTTITNREIEDTKILLEYFQSVQQILATAAQLMNTVEPKKSLVMFNENRMHDHLTMLLKLCRAQDHYLKRAIDINIYRVVIPEEYYDSIYSQSESFHYEGRATATAKVVGGSILGIPLGIVSLFIIGFSEIGGKKAIKYTCDFHDRTTGKILKIARNGITYYGYGCKSIILPEWIETVITPEGDRANPSFQGYEAGKRANNIIYILDARNPKMVFEEGINYTWMNTPLNPHGSVIFFKKFKDARRCAELRHDGAYYDATAGWRLYNTWKEEELADVYNARKLKEVIMPSTKLPEPLTDIVTEYMGRPSRRC